MSITKAKVTYEVESPKKPSLEQIQKIEKKGIKKNTRKAKTTKEPKIKKEYTLIVTEKPQAATKIANALSNGDYRELIDSGIRSYLFEKNNKKIIVACAVGHLFGLSQDEKGAHYPIFNISWKPNFKIRKKDFTKRYYDVLSRLVKKSNEIIIATDYDTEGEVIGYNIVRFIAHEPDAKRMKFSSLTKEELEQAYQNVHPKIDWGQAIAGETRHYIDWYYGINLSRALMNSVKSTGKFKIMSIGRIQGPTLKLIVDKEKEIKKFEPQAFWRVYINIVEKKDKKNKLKLKYIKDITKKDDLRMFEELKGETAEVSTKKTQQTIIPPPPFDLTSLQTEAYKFFSINPARTLEIAQRLYLTGLISYPRTNSQKIPDSVNPQQILKKLMKYYPQIQKITKTKPIEGKKSDPAHPSIMPTGELQNLQGEEEKIYDLIARRFISCFSDNAKVENKTITAVTKSKNQPEKELTFKARGLEIKEKGWMDIYKTKLNEKEIKDMDGIADIKKVIIEEDETKPPRRYSPASIISELEKRDLGTKATRAGILETLYKRDYVRGQKSIEATPIGLRLIESLEKYSPIIVDEELTKTMEKDTEKIRESTKELGKKQELILIKARKAVEMISQDFHKNEEKIGKDIINANEELWKQQEIENELFECPVCKKGKLTIKYSPKVKKYFVACNAYPNCKTTFSLPPNGNFKKTDKICEKCGFQMLMSLKKGKKPWIFCFNPKCWEKEKTEESSGEE